MDNLSTVSIVQLVAHLQDLGVKLNFVNGELKVKAPKGVLAGELLEVVRDRKQALSAYIEEITLTQQKAKNKIEVVDREQLLPLSYGQQRLWFLDQLIPDSAFYNIPSALKLVGHLDVERFEKSIKSVIARHENLRTIFKEVDDTPIQVVQDGLDWKLDQIDLSQHSDRDGEKGKVEEKARKLVMDLCQRPFKLDSGPLLRVHLIKTNNDPKNQTQYLVLLMHHIIGDGWSNEILVREIVTSYFIGEAALAPLVIQYADYAVWQRKYISGEVLEKQLKYWRQRLAEVPVLQLPLDKPRPPVESHRGAVVPLYIDKVLCDRLKAMGEMHRASLFMVLMSAYQVLIHRYSGQLDFAVGTPIANRGKEELNALIGFFVNTLALRSELEEDITFDKLIGKVKKSTLDAYGHQDLPFEQIVDDLKLERAMSHSPIFQTMLVLNASALGNKLDTEQLNAVSANSALSELQVSFLEREHNTAKFDLNCELAEVEGGLLGHFEYNTDLFDKESIERLSQNFIRLISALTNNPDSNVCEIEYLDEREQQTQLIEWNQTQKIYPKFSSVRDLLDLSFKKHAQAPALSFDGETLSYQDLDSRSDHLASLMSERLGGGGRATNPPVVALCLERSFDLVIALLACLKVGSPYLPLDASLPKDRIDFMLADSDAALVITEKTHSELFDGEGKQQVLRVDDSETIAKLRPSARDGKPVVDSVSLTKRNSNPDDLFNIIYTSGSTGNPKGVMVPNKGILNRIQWMQDEYQLQASDRVLQKTTYSFDVSVWEFIWPLSAGACLVLAKPEGHKDSSYLKNIIIEEKISHCHFVPSMLSTFMEAEDLRACTTLKQVFCSGEALTGEMVKDFYKDLPNTELHNLYGPTEASIDVSYWHCVQDTDEKDIKYTIPIGKPVANTQLLVLDRNKNLVPQGVAGELFIGGVQLAQGYLNRMSLTSEMFIENPFQEIASDRLYKTGDLVRFNGRRELEYLGRTDHQVKIRGYRIELGEIEAVLEALPQVSQAVLLARDYHGDKRLVAYVVLQKSVSKASDYDKAKKAQELLDAMSKRLAEFMLPSVIVFLGKLPLLNNGKINRKALPEPEYQTKVYVAPSDDTQKLIAEIWQNILHIEQVGIHDNFFELGGHSLLATKALARIRAKAEKNVSLLNLFEHPVLENLASFVDLSATVKDFNIPVLDRPDDAALTVALSYGQERLWFLDQLNPGNSFFNMPAVMRLQGVLDLDRFEASIQKLIARHEVLRTRFSVIDEDPCQVIEAKTSWKLELIDLRKETLNSEQIESSALMQAQSLALAPFDLERGALLRVNILQLAENEFILVVVMHHIISDGWSIEVLVKEIVQSYLAPDALLPKLRIQYADYAVWQKAWLDEARLQTQLDYWCEYLHDVPVLQLPTDKARPAIETHRGALCSVTIDRELTRKIKACAQQNNCTDFMVLLASFYLLLSRYSGQKDFAIGTPIANRGHIDLENMIGFFINTLAIRIQTESNTTLKGLLALIKENTLQAFNYQDTPFEKIVDALNVTREMSHSPVFQSMLILNAENDASFLQALDSTVDDGLDDKSKALKISAIEGAHQSAKHDITLQLRESEKQFSGSFEYNTDLFSENTIVKLKDNFLRLLAALFDTDDKARDKRIYQVNLLSEQEKTTQLVDWNQTQAEYPQQSISQLFRECAIKNPQATALKFSGESYSYQSLDESSARLANYLCEQGLEAGDRVALCVDRSPQMIISLLAILKMGASYVPVDPDYPQERIAYVIEHSAPKLVITEAKHLEKTHLEKTKSDVLVLDQQQDAVQGCAAEFSLSEKISVLDTAYIIYTSGSTGLPKGVVISHKAFVNFIFAMRDELDISLEDRILALTSLSFDIAGLELWAPLLFGASLVLADKECGADATELKALIQSEKINLMQATPATWKMLVEDDWQVPVQEGLTENKLFKALCGGEALAPNLASDLLSRELRLFNMYGPTETTVWSALKEIKVDDEKILVGKAIHNTQLYVLDESREPLPTGAIGELYISGDGLAEGYFKQNDLTEERFVENPFAKSLFSKSDGAERMYWTGDLARWTVSGELECLGRVDSQVKIRGFRIELGEIENVLSQYENIKELVVLVKTIGAESALVAYCVFDSPNPDSEDKIKNNINQYLATRLPSYMLPSAYIILGGLPLTPNGKVDRKALPEPSFEQSEFIQAESDTQKALLDIWQRVLLVDDISIRSNFFDMGGHSLKATKVVSRVRSELNVIIPLKELFVLPTIEKMADYIDTLKWMDDENSKNEASSGGTDPVDSQDDEREEFEL